VGHESQVLLAAVLYVQRTLGRVGLHGLSDRLVQDAVDDAKRLSLQAQAALVGQIVDAAAQNVVLRNDLFDIEPVLRALQPMRRRAAFEQRLGDRLIRLHAKRGGHLLEEHWDVIVERRDVEMSRGGELPHLPPPTRQQRIPVPCDERRQLVQNVVRHLLSLHYFVSTR